MLIKNKARIDHSKNAQLAYMIITHDLKNNSEESDTPLIPEPSSLDPFGDI